MRQIGNLFASLDRCEYAQWERCCGLSLRVGEWVAALGHIDYREKRPAWPRWLQFSLSIAGPIDVSMSKRRRNYLYLFGRRVFDTAYWEPRQ